MRVAYIFVHLFVLYMFPPFQMEVQRVTFREKNSSKTTKNASKVGVRKECAKSQENDPPEGRWTCDPYAPARTDRM